jgi:hypothetical protein
MLADAAPRNSLRFLLYSVRSWLQFIFASRKLLSVSMFACALATPNPIAALQPCSATHAVAKIVNFQYVISTPTKATFPQWIANNHQVLSTFLTNQGFSELLHAQTLTFSGHDPYRRDCLAEAV